MILKSFRSVLRTLVLLSPLVMAACGEEDSAAQQAAPPPPEVAVLEIQPKPVPLSVTYAGRVRAVSEVEVRAQVNGILQKRHYVEGATVKEGDLLFTIDPAPYEAELNQAKAQLQQQQAQLEKAQLDAERAKTLFKQGVGSEKSRDDAVSALALAKAAVSYAEAQVDSAELNLGYTRVTAPITGITSLEVLPQGSLVENGALLTRINQVDPVYVIFSFTDRELSDFRALVDSGRVIRAADNRIAVRVQFGDGREYPREGYVDFTSSTVDTETGTIQARGVLPNPDNILLPGQFVRVIVSGITLKDGITVPQQAVMQGPQGTFVYTVDKAGNAAVRPVHLGRETPEGWLVTEGLQAGDRVVTEGMVKVRPGSPVKVAEPKPPALGPAAPAAPEQEKKP